MKVYVNIEAKDSGRSEPREALIRGLEKIGHKVCGDPQECHLLLTWTPWENSDRAVLKQDFEKAGRPVICIENGWLSPIDGRRYWQIAFGGWNGTGIFPAWKGPDRWDSWGIELLPWKTSFQAGGAPGESVMVAPQAIALADPRSMPIWWTEVICGFLDSQEISYTVRKKSSPVPLEEALDQSWLVCTWNSSLATKAVIRGVPVRFFGPQIMVSKLCTRGLGEIKLRDRLPVLRKLAGSQFSAQELANGWPLDRLIKSWDPGPFAQKPKKRVQLRNWLPNFGHR